MFNVLQLQNQDLNKVFKLGYTKSKFFDLFITWIHIGGNTG